MATVRETVKEIFEVLGRTRLSVNFFELFTVLIYHGLITPRVAGHLFPIPGNYTLVIDIEVPKNKISIAAQWRLFVDTDHALDLKVYIDDKLIMHDNDVVQTNYTNPINFFEIGALVPIKRNIRIEVKNKTANLVNLNYWTTYGEVNKKIFEEILARYFNVILREAEKTE